MDDNSGNQSKNTSILQLHFRGQFLVPCIAYGDDQEVLNIKERSGNTVVFHELTGIVTQQSEKAIADFDLLAPEFEEGSKWFKVTLSMTRVAKLITEERYSVLLLWIIPVHDHHLEVITRLMSLRVWPAR